MIPTSSSIVIIQTDSVSTITVQDSKLDVKHLLALNKCLASVSTFGALKIPLTSITASEFQQWVVMLYYQLLS